jgi:hypothetical protein
LTAIVNSVATVSVLRLLIANSNFQQSPLIVFYKMATNNQNTGINAITIGDNSPHIAEASLDKDAILTIKGSDEQFIPSNKF